MNKYRQVETMLKNYTMNKIYIKNAKAEIEVLNEIDGIGAMTYDQPTSGPTNKVGSVVESVALSKVERLKELEENIAARQLEVTKVENAIQGLTEDERIILEGFYIEDKKWWEVASEAEYCEGYCKEIRSKAIRKIVKGILE